MEVKLQACFLRNRQCLACVHPANLGCRRIVGEHKGSVRDARGAIKSIFSYLSALPAIQVHPELDGCTPDIAHCFYNIARHFSR